MKKEKIWQMALASGLCDADVSNDHQICTDYGDATEAVEKFAAMISAAEREACKADCTAQKVDASATGDATDAAYNLALDHAIAAMTKRSNVLLTGSGAKEIEGKNAADPLSG